MRRSTGVPSERAGCRHERARGRRHPGGDRRDPALGPAAGRRPLTAFEQPVVVGVDATGSVRALAWAADRALATGCRVVAVHTVAGLPAATHPLDGWMDLARDQALTSAILEEQCQQVLGTRGVPWDAEVVSAPATTALVSIARRRGASALVLERPSTRWRLLRLTPLLLHAPCPVVLVGAPESVPAAWSARPARSRP